MKYGSWYKVRQTEVFVTLGHFLPFQPTDNPENQNFEIEKTPVDIIILHICTINDNLRPGVRQKEFFVILDCFFALLLPWQPEKSRFWKNEKNGWRYHFTQMYQKSWSYATLFLRYIAWRM